jgi:hypothetical protein
MSGAKPFTQPMLRCDLTTKPLTQLTPYPTAMANQTKQPLPTSSAAGMPDRGASSKGGMGAPAVRRGRFIQVGVR